MALLGYSISALGRLLSFFYPCSIGGLSVFRLFAFSLTMGRMDADAKVCYCFHVTRRKLVNYIRVNRPKVPSQLSECGGAGTGCGWCIPFLKQLHQQAVSGGETELERLTPAEYEKLRAAYVRAGKGTPPPGATPLPSEDESNPERGASAP
jgi:bacterioferritin-associated ferredoxin